MQTLFHHRSGVVGAALLLGVCLALFSGCHGRAGAQADYVVTLSPLKMILEPLTAGRKSVACLVPPGASPHTFTLRPSDVERLSSARTVFYFDQSLDGWAAQLAPGSSHALMAMVPPSMLLPFDFDHDHGDGSTSSEYNPHIWSDPELVSAVVPELVKILIANDPEGRAVYEANAAAFLDELELLDQSLKASMATRPPMTLVAFHPSWSYFFQRYGVSVAAYVEPVPGKELTPQTILELRNELRDRQPVVILSEVQLPRRSADALAEALGAHVVEIDPLGGRPPLDSYAKLLRANAERLGEHAQ